MFKRIFQIVAILAIMAAYLPAPVHAATAGIPADGHIYYESGDGNRQSPAEPDAGNVEVRLHSATKRAVLAKSTTNADGDFSLTIPGPGDYVIRVVHSGGKVANYKVSVPGDVVGMGFIFGIGN